MGNDVDVEKVVGFISVVMQYVLHGVWCMEDGEEYECMWKIEKSKR